MNTKRVTYSVQEASAGQEVLRGHWRQQADRVGQIKDGTLQVEYLGDIPLIVGGPAGLSGDEQAA